MGIFGTLFKTVIDTTVGLPIAIVKDVCTLGGTMIEEESAVKEKLSDIKEDLDQLTDKE